MTTTIWQGWRLPKLPVEQQGGDHSRARDRLYREYTEQSNVLEILHHFAPSLARGEHDIEMSDEQLDTLLSVIHGDCTGLDLVTRHNFFVKGLDEGVRQLDWQLTVPSPMSIIKKEKSPFTTSSFASLHALDYLDSFYMRYLESGKEPQQEIIQKKYPEIKAFRVPWLFHAGQILYSAITRGGLLNNTWIESLGESLRGTPPVVNINQSETLLPPPLLWVNLSFEKKRGASSETVTRRWLPDPFTGLLIIEWHKKGYSWPKIEGPHKARQQVNHLLSIFYTIIQLPPHNQPSLPKLIEASKTRLSLSTPKFLVNYAVSLNQSPSLSDQAWIRFHYQKKIDEYIPIKDKTGTSNESTHDLTFPTQQNRKNKLNKAGTTDQAKEYIRLRKCLYRRGNEKKSLPVRQAAT